MSTLQYVLHQEGAAAARPRLLYVTHAQYSEEWNSSLHTHACAELFFITRATACSTSARSGSPWPSTIWWR